jgi:PAS domain S-box-containing protein
MEEHRMLIRFAGDLRTVSKALTVQNDLTLNSEQVEHITHLVDHFKDSKSHYLREENILFPYLEKHGITGPTKIMWTEHGEIHDLEKKIYTIIEQQDEGNPHKFIDQLGEIALVFAENLSSHYYKENNILFPAALRLIEENEWVQVRQEFDELGYCGFTPELPDELKPTEVVPTATRQIEGMVPFETGPLSTDVVEAIMNTLPVDVTFVDANDRVRYFSQGKERIFVRTKAIIGRTVQACHPSKSIHVVNQILADFKSGKRESAEFWLELDGKFIHIQYYPVHNRSGEYMGCIEVSQDITDIKKLEGAKTLLDG